MQCVIVKHFVYLFPLLIALQVNPPNNPPSRGGCFPRSAFTPESTPPKELSRSERGIYSSTSPDQEKYQGGTSSSAEKGFHGDSGPPGQDAEMQSAVEAALTTPPFGITSSSPVHYPWTEPSPMHIDTDLFTSGSQAQGSEGDLQQQNVADTLAGMQDDPDPYALPSVPSDLAKDKEVLTGVFADAHKAGLRPFSPPGSDPFTVSQEIYRSESRSRDVPPANKRAPTEGISHHFS